LTNHVTAQIFIQILSSLPTNKEVSVEWQNIYMGRGAEHGVNPTTVRRFWTGDMAQVVEHLPSKNEALSLVTSTTKKIFVSFSFLT
jgi:hypothetical protein